MAERGQQEAPQRRNWAQPVAQDASGLAANAFARAGFGDPTLVLRWAEIVGADVARIARPLRFSDDAKGGVLTLMAEPAAAVFLEHETRNLCARINSYLGRPLVARLRFVSHSIAEGRPPLPQAVAAAVLPPDDPVHSFEGPDSLKAALVGLAAARTSRHANQSD